MSAAVVRFLILDWVEFTSCPYKTKKTKKMHVHYSKYKNIKIILILSYRIKYSYLRAFLKINIIMNV